MAATDVENGSEVNVTTEDNPFTPQGMDNGPWLIWFSTSVIGTQATPATLFNPFFVCV